MSSWLEKDAALSSRLSLAEQPGWRRTLALILAHSGDSWFWFAGLILTLWLGPSEWRYRAVILLAGIAAIGILVALIKQLVRRARPEGVMGTIYRKTDPHSFPSGHSARAGLLAVLGLALGPPWFGALLAAWGPLLALARVAIGVHYVSDIVAGFLLGMVVAGGIALLI